MYRFVDHISCHWIFSHCHHVMSNCLIDDEHPDIVQCKNSSLMMVGIMTLGNKSSTFDKVVLNRVCAFSSKICLYSQLLNMIYLYKSDMKIMRNRFMIAVLSTTLLLSECACTNSKEKIAEKAVQM